jgi:hypothetical protein
MTRRCTRCGAEFTPAADYHRLCWPCWRADHDAQARDAAYRAGYAEGLRDAMRSSLHRGNLDSSVLRDAITLCHPDKHPVERAETANRVTRALLEAWNHERSRAA